MTFEVEGVKYSLLDMICVGEFDPYVLGVYVTNDRQRAFVPVILPSTGVDVWELKGHALQRLAEDTSHPDLARVVAHQSNQGARESDV